MSPQIGYLLPTRERVMEGRPETAPLLELAARAEGLGFDAVWVAQHHFHELEGGLPSPLIFLTHAAARTSRIRLGTAISWSR